MNYAKPQVIRSLNTNEIMGCAKGNALVASAWSKSWANSWGNGHTPNQPYVG